MIKEKLKVSNLIENSCCGTLLDVPKHKLVLMAKELEADNEHLTAEVKRLDLEKKRTFKMNLVFSLFHLTILFFIYYQLAK